MERSYELDTQRSILIHQMIPFLLAAFLMAQAPAPQSPDAAKGVIQGSVIAADTGAPIGGVRVVLRSMAPVPPGATPTNPSGMTTDEQGRFESPLMSPGSYGLIVDDVASRGYARQAYGAARPGMDGIAELTPISLAAGQKVEGIVVRLVRAGTISGRVLGSTGQPFVDAEVRIHRARFSESGNKSLIGEGTPIKVNDRGEFRFFGIDPGQIYLHAGPQILQIFEASGGEASRYAEMTVYPRAASFKDALPLEVKPGAELTNMDIQLLPRPPVFSVRGRLFDSRTGQPPAASSIQLMLVPRDREVGNLRGYKQEIEPDGTFKLNEVVEGEYWISAQLRLPMARPLPGEIVTRLPALFAFQRIEVRGADVSGVALTFAPSVQVSGRVSSEAPLPPGIFVQFDLVRNSAFTMNMGASPKPAAVGSDGTFVISDVAQGEYRATLIGLPNGFYAKEAQLAAVDALVEPVTIGATAPDRMEISLERGNGRIQGQLANAQNQAVANGQVVLIPNKLRDRVALYKTATSDAMGRFSFAGILPGEYKAFAWERITPFRYFDKDFVALVEERGEPVLAEDGANKTITVHQIP